MTILVPKDTDELKIMLDYAVSLNSPVAIRYPNGVCAKIEGNTHFRSDSLWEELKVGGDSVIFACGPRMIEIALKAAEKHPVTVVNARSVKPLDEKMLMKYSGKKIITLEDNSEIGGFGSMVASFYLSRKIKADVSVLGVKDKFVDHASVSSQLNINGLTVENVLELLK